MSRRRRFGIKVSGEGESLVEAYHSVFSALSSTKHIYRELAILCGSDFVYASSSSGLTKNTIFCKHDEETHYRYFDATHRKVYDPYKLYQLYNSHGNCFAFALYISSEMNGANMFPNKLVDVSPFIEKVGTGRTRYLRVKPADEKKAYNAFVKNDHLIINMMLEIVSANQHIYDMYESEWDSMADNERQYYDIDQGYSFDAYMTDFKHLAKSIDTVHSMTWYQITNWDSNLKENPQMEDCDNSGIPGAGSGNPGTLKESDYKDAAPPSNKTRRKKVKRNI